MGNKQTNKQKSPQNQQTKSLTNKQTPPLIDTRFKTQNCKPQFLFKIQVTMVSRKKIILNTI